MTHTTFAALAALLVALVGPASALAQTSATNPPVQTPDRANTADVAHAAAAPLKDLNVVRQQIPPVLLAAIADPYVRPGRGDCLTITGEVAELNAILGADFDEPETAQTPSLARKRGKLALALVHGAAESLLPFAGYVRTLSGAQKHDELVMEAITAGSVRRGYLKGLGEAHRCYPPGAPVHPLHPRPPVRDDAGRPQYPIN